MKAVKFIRNSRVLKDSEKECLIRNVLPLLRQNIKYDIEYSQTAVYSPKNQKWVWGKSSITSKEAAANYFAAKIASLKRKIENFRYDVDVQPSEANNKDYSKSEITGISPHADPLCQLDVILPALGYTKVRTDALPERVPLGGGVMARYRPPKDSTYTVSIWVRSPLSTLSQNSIFSVPAPAVKTNNAPAIRTTNASGLSILRNRSNEAKPKDAVQSTQVPSALSYPAFEGTEMKQYARVRSSIEDLFTSIEDYVVKKMRDAMHIMHRLQSTVTMSYFWHMGKFFVELSQNLWNYILSLVHDREMPIQRNTSHAPEIILPSFSWSDQSTTHCKSHSDRHYSTELTGRNPKMQPYGDIRDSNRVYEDVVVGARWVSTSGEAHTAMRILSHLPLSVLPLTVPNATPRDTSLPYITIRLSRAELVMFISLIGLGAAPAVYRSLNFAFEHPIFAQAVCLSLLLTVGSSAWNNRCEIRTATYLRVANAVAARLRAQNESALALLRAEYIDSITEDVVLAYCAEVISERSQNSAQRNSTRIDESVDKDIEKAKNTVETIVASEFFPSVVDAFGFSRDAGSKSMRNPEEVAAHLASNSKI